MFPHRGYEECDKRCNKMAFRAIVQTYESVEDKISPVASTIYFYKHACNSYACKFYDKCITRWLSVHRAHQAARQSRAVDRGHKLLIPSLYV
jgi:hypothetical protein